MTPAAIIRELLERWDTYRARWIELYGSDAGFEEWFTLQVMEA